MSRAEIASHCPRVLSCVREATFSTFVEKENWPVAVTLWKYTRPLAGGRKRTVGRTGRGKRDDAKANKSVVREVIGIAVGSERLNNVFAHHMIPVIVVIVQ